MEEMTLIHSTERLERGQIPSAQGQRSSGVTPRNVVISLIVFMLSFAVLFAGPALVLRLMASTVEQPAGSSFADAPNVHAAQATVTIFQQGVRPTAAYTGSYDTYIKEWDPTYNGGTEVRLVIGQSGAWRSLLYFDLTPGAIPAGATVISAELAIYCYDWNMVRSMDIEVYQVKRSWTELGATWQKATATDFWGLAGCNDPVTDRFPVPASTKTVYNTRDFHRFDVTSIVQNWVSDPSSNKGLLLVGPNPTVIYYYASSEWPNPDERPMLSVSWLPGPLPTPTPTQTTTPVATPTRTATPTPTPTVTPAAPYVIIDNTSVCYSDFPPEQWDTAIGASGYTGSYRYETTDYLTGTATFSPCVESPLPQDGVYAVQAHWSVHSARPVAVPYIIHYYGGSVTIPVDQTRDISGTARDFAPSGWYTLGYYPFRAGTAAANGEYVELNTSSPGHTCADAVRWVLAPDKPGPPYTLMITASPTELPSDGTSTATIMVTVTDWVGKMVADGTMVGLTTTLGTLPYNYVEAESAAVTKMGSWTNAGTHIYSNTPGDEVSWTFRGESVSVVYITNNDGGLADVSVDGVYVTTINFASPSLQWQRERQLVSSLSPGVPHTLRIRHAGGGYVRLDAFRSGTVTSGGVATATLLAPTVPGLATIYATAIGEGVVGAVPDWPRGSTTVSFPGPSEVWVDDDYCSTCANDGHVWGYDAFNTIQGGVNGVISNGTVHVLPGTYTESVTIAKPLNMLGSGSSVVSLVGTGAMGSRGFYVDRADNVTIQGFTIRNFDTGVYLRGTGAGPGPRVYNATVVYNTFESHSSYAIRGSYVYTSTICSNDISLGNNGIYLENAYGNTVCFNNISASLGFGIKLATGDDNSIDNNEVYDNQNVGIEVVGQAQRNGIYGNNLHDLWWDGILVSGTVASDVHVGANIVANTNQSWRNAQGALPDDYHNLGGIVLIGITTGSEVRNNRITGTGNAMGSRTDAAGVYLLNNAAPITVEANLIQGSLGHGVYITSCTGLPVLHGNSIYGNTLFGLNNRLATRVHAEGNWWGRNSPTFGPSTPADIRTAASAYYSPPISLTLTAAPTSIFANGVDTSTITATASGGGYNILDGTWITFTSDLNTTVSPMVVAFGNGRARTILTAGTLAGVATVTGTAEPGIEGQFVTVTLLAGSPHSMTIDVAPRTIPNSCDPDQNRAAVTVTVRDRYNNPVPGIPVTFTCNALGSVFPPVTATMAGTGVATTTFTSGVLTGTAVITTTAGPTLTMVASITVTAGPPSAMNILAHPSSLPANGIATSTITVTLRDCLGYPVPDGTMVAFTATQGTIINQEFAEAESTAVVKSAGWTVLADSIRGDVAGASAYWLFRGEAVSLIYRRSTGGGVMRVRIDGGAPVDIDTSGSSAWIERVIVTGLNPNVVHQIDVTCLSTPVRLDAFRSGTFSSGGVARAILRAPALVILGPGVYTSTVYATSRLGHPVLPNMVVTTVVTFTQADVVWVNDDWASLANGTLVTLPPEHGSGIVTIGFNAFDTIPEGVAAVQEGGTVQVLTGTYASPVVITKTLNLLGDGSANTFITGGGTGTGIEVERFADGVTIEGFTIRNFGYGVHLDGRSGNRVDGFTFANNVITGCVTGAITATYLNNGYFADNMLANNGGFGLDLYVGDPNRIINNQIYGISGFGLRIRNALGTEISYNNVHDVEWDGIFVGDSCTNTLVLHNTVRTTNRVNSPSGFNEGGIVLYNTIDTTVDHNDISDVRDAGGSTDTAGIWIGGTDTGAVIRYNRILNNVNDGVLLWGFDATSPPVINCNHIYGNLRFGLRNTQATTVNAEGNWWGHNVLSTGTSVPPRRDIYRPPANVDYTPWVTIVLTPSQPTVSAGGGAIVITATGSGGGCSVLDDTPITFTSSLGLLGDPPRSVVTDTMNGGQVTVQFTPGTVAGTAIITGTVPDRGIVTTTVTILPLEPFSIAVTAYPTRIRVNSTSAISAEVRDRYNNVVLPGTMINFDTSLGGVAPISNSTDANGIVTTTLYSGITPGIATVRAYKGSAMGFADVEIIAGPPFTITSLFAVPDAIPADGVSTALVTAILRDEYGNLVPDDTMVGFTTTVGSLIYDYAEAESGSVIKSAGWSGPLSDAGASGGQYMQTSSAGAYARWNFRGEAISLLYRLGGGVMSVQIDGGAPITIDTSGAAVWVEQVLATDLDPTALHVIEVTRQSGTIRLDAFRSGTVTQNGQAVAQLTSQPLPPTAATVWATGIDLRGIVRTTGSFPTRTVTVPFLRPTEVWVDDNYCSTCPNDGHRWGFDAFDNIPDGVAAVADGGTVHVADGTYSGPVTVGKRVYLDGAGSGGTTALVGTGTGNGILVTHLGDGTTIEGFAIRNFAYGINLAGRSANPIQGITITHNAITGCATGAITATYVNNGYFADNVFHHNDGFGLDLDSGNDNEISNNHIYENGGFGLRLFSSSATGSDNIVAMNTIYNIGWDGIRIGVNMYDTQVLSNTVSNTNRRTGGGFDLGGIALYGTTDTLVEGNTVTDVQDGGGALADTAGIGMDGNNVRPVILNNLIRNNKNHGIWLSTNGYTAGGPAEIHGNSIYSNRRFGICNNVTAAAADAEGNWWGRNSPRTSANPADTGYDIFTGLGANVDYTPPIVLTLARSPTAIVADGLSTANITATMRCATCIPPYNVLNGTLITFTSSMGSLGTPPVVRSTFNGEATVVLRSSTIVGRAYITATTPSAGSASTWVDFIAGAPYTISMSATPASIWSLSCAYPGYPVTSTIEVTVTDQFGNPCVGQPVTYTLTPGMGASLAWTTGVLDGNGYHLTILNSGGVAGTVWVTATVGTRSRAIPVAIMPGIARTSMDLIASPSVIAADGVSTATLRATVYDDCQNLAYDGTMVGFVTSQGVLPYGYVEAESAEVTASANWTLRSPFPNASGNAYLETNTPGAWASWSFMGSAVSVIYRRDNGGGLAQVLIDGVPRTTISMFSASVEWQRETVVATDLDPSLPHIIQVNCLTGKVYLDAFRSGTTTTGGVATAVLTSVPISTTAYITATAVDSRVPHLSLTERVSRTTTVRFERANLGISKIADRVDVPPEELVTFTIFYTNTGQGQGTNTLITDTLPTLLEYVSSASSPDVGSPSNPSDNVWVWHAGNVQPGARGVITLTARHSCQPGLGWVTNTVSIRSLTLEANVQNNTAEKAVRLVPSTPFTVTVTATPLHIPVNSSSTVRITVLDRCGNPVQGSTVYITTSLGSFNATAIVTHTTRTTDGNGQATTTFYSHSFTGMAVISATAGTATGVGYVWMNIGPAAQCVAVADPMVIPADGVSTSDITARVFDTAGYIVPDGVFVGFTTSLGSLIYGYAEDPQLVQSPIGSWDTVYDMAASGGTYISTTLNGASIIWGFSGNGVSIVYRRAPGGGWVDVSVDGTPLGGINMGGTLTWRAEKAYTWPGDPTAPHVLRVTHRTGTGPVWIDALRSGVTTSGGRALAVLTSEQTAGTAIVAATAVSETAGIVPVLLPGFVNVRFDPADLIITKTVEPAGSVSIGERITFTLSYENRGPITATNAYVEDVIHDAALSSGWLQDVFFSVMPQTIVEHLHYRWNLGSLPARRTGVITFGGTVAAGPGYYWPSETVLTNTASIASLTVDSDPENNTSWITKTIVPGAPVTISLTATPRSIPVNCEVSGNSSLLRAEVRDIYGNPVRNGTPVTFTTNLGGFPTAQERVRYTTNGVATVNLTAGTVAGTAMVTATVDSLMATTQVVFTPQGPSSVIVSANPPAIPVGGATSVIEALVRDACGNWVTDGTAVSFSTDGGTIAPSLVGTANGRASAVLVSGIAPVTATVVATAGTVSGTTTVRFVPGEPRLRLDVYPTTVPVSNTVRITVTARDEFGNPVLDGTMVTFTTSLGYFTDSQITRTFTTTVGGRAFAALHSTQAGQAVVRASIGPHEAAVIITFEPSEPWTISLTVEPEVIVGCGGTALARAVVRDRYGNPVRDGTVVEFLVCERGRVEPTDRGRAVPIDGGRTTNGVAQATIYSGAKPGPATVYAWPYEGLRTTWLAEKDVTFLAGPPDHFEPGTPIAEPQRLLVGGKQARIKVRVLDCGNYPVADGTPVTFTLAVGAGTLTPQTTGTANGWAYATLTSPNETGRATIRINAGEREGIVIVEYIPEAPFDVTVTANPLSIAADGVSTSTIDAEVKDLYGNYVADGIVVVFSTDLGRFETGSSFTAYTGGGRARAVLISSTTPGMARVAATAGGKRGETYVDFYFVPTPTPTPPPTPTPTRRWSVHMPIIMKNYRR